MPAGREGTAWAVLTFGSCARLWFLLILLHRAAPDAPFEKCLHRDSSILQLFTKKLRNTREFAQSLFRFREVEETLYSQVPAAVYLLCNPLGNFEY